MRMLAKLQIRVNCSAIAACNRGGRAYKTPMTPLRISSSEITNISQ
jgi:hypothetical protein